MKKDFSHIKHIRLFLFSLSGVYIASPLVENEKKMFFFFSIPIRTKKGTIRKKNEKKAAEKKNEI